MRLHELQHRLLDFIQNQKQREAFTDRIDLIQPTGSLDRESALAIYKNAYQFRLIDSLAVIYEAVSKIILNDFKTIASLYIQKYPSHFYSLTDYGEHFADFLNSLILQSAQKLNPRIEIETTTLVDLARFEWAFSRIFHSAAMPADIAISPALSQLETIPLQLASSTYLFCSNESVYRIWKDRNLTENESANYSQSQCGLLYRTPVEHGIFVKELKMIQFRFCECLVRGMSLDQIDSHLETESMSESAEEQITDIVHFLFQRKLLRKAASEFTDQL